MFGKALTAFGARSDVHTNAYSPVAATQTPAAAEPTGAKWNCDKCSNANDAGAMTCNLCSAPRHAPGVSAQAVMLAGRPQSSAFGATPVMPVMPPTSRNQVIPQPSDSDSDGSGEEELVDQQQQQNAQFQMQAPPSAVSTAEPAACSSTTATGASRSRSSAGARRRRCR